MQGSSTQMMPQMPQHLIGLNQNHPGSIPPGNMPPMGSFPNGMGNIQGSSVASGMQNFPMGSMYNRPQGQMAPQGQMSSIPGLGSYQVRFPSHVNGLFISELTCSGHDMLCKLFIRTGAVAAVFTQVCLWSCSQGWAMLAFHHRRRSILRLAVQHHSEIL